jgi:hypothetical protein
MSAGITFDTGALIALEAGRLAMRTVYARALQRGQMMTVPSVVVAEWWPVARMTKERARLLRFLSVEALGKHLAMRAGTVLGLVSGSTLVDAVVMTSAALRGDTVYTSDVADLQRLRACVSGFREVQISRA